MKMSRARQTQKKREFSPRLESPTISQIMPTGSQSNASHFSCLILTSVAKLLMNKQTEFRCKFRNQSKKLFMDVDSNFGVVELNRLTM